MSARRVLGTSLPVQTGLRKEVSNSEANIVTVEGLYSELEHANHANFCPSGFTVESTSLEETGGGLGKLTLRCIKYENAGSTFSAVRTTFRIDMLEVTYDLEDHPHVKPGRPEILMWLATPEAKRGTSGSYKYVDANGALQPVRNASAVKFCDAYMAGITTFNRYYPVIEKISIWKNPPGMHMSGRDFTGGSPTFSANIGKYNAPPIDLNGYPATNWFKSKDSWIQNADTTWTRTEQWTYTPESSSGTHAWIYNNLT